MMMRLMNIRMITTTHALRKSMIWVLLVITIIETLLIVLMIFSLTHVNIEIIDKPSELVVQAIPQRTSPLNTSLNIH